MEILEISLVQGEKNTSRMFEEAIRRCLSPGESHHDLQWERAPAVREVDSFADDRVGGVDEQSREKVIRCCQMG